MSEPSAKRRRTEDDATLASTTVYASLPIPFPTSIAPRPTATQANAPSWAQIIATLPEATLRSCLLKAVTQDPRIGTVIIAPYLRPATERQSSATVFFNNQVNVVATAINDTYAHPSGSRQFDASGDALKTVLDAIGQIHDSVAEHSSFATKRNGLSALCDIGVEIADGDNDVIAREVRNHFGFDSCLEDAMFEIVETLSESERASLRAGPQAFESQLVELMELARGYCIFESLEDVFGLLTGEVESDDDDDNEEDEDE